MSELVILSRRNGGPAIRICGRCAHLGPLSEILSILKHWLQGAPLPPKATGDSVRLLHWFGHPTPPPGRGESSRLSESVRIHIIAAVLCVNSSGQNYITRSTLMKSGRAETVVEEVRAVVAKWPENAAQAQVMKNWRQQIQRNPGWICRAHKRFNQNGFSARKFLSIKCSRAPARLARP